MFLLQFYFCLKGNIAQCIWLEGINFERVEWVLFARLRRFLQGFLKFATCGSVPVEWEFNPAWEQKS